MNIEGVERLMALFEPPIDPGLLVRATASGLSMGDLLKDMNAPRPLYRFNIMLQKANELCADVKALGGAFLSALEKKDAEQLALIRQSHESKILEMTRDVKDSQVKEIEQNLEALQKSKEAAEMRFEYYSSRPFMNDQEQTHVDSVKSSLPLQMAQGALENAAAAVSILPEIKIGTPTTMGATLGGANFASAIRATSAAIGIAVTVKNVQGTLASIQGGYQRRADDWKFQADSAAKEIEQFDKQILANEIRLAIANRELAIHDTQIENASEINDFMTSKFTNQQLYDWMIGQLSAVYFQSYQLAYDMAKRAQRCYEYELGLEDNSASFIQFGYWDGLKKGLLSGEKLQYDLRRMEASYLQENKRDLELQKHISMAIVTPDALLALKKDGKCTFDIPEIFFDLDYPGHYFRRIKSVSITIPCVTGPFITVNATLRLNNHWTRKIDTKPPENGDAKINYCTYYRYDADNKCYTYGDLNGLGQSVACSSAQNDSGLFELNFRDERYLPFEGCGAFSNWTLELTETEALRQFDYQTISDVILHIKYTAKDGGDSRKTAVEGFLASVFSSVPCERVFSMRHEFPTQWHRFLREPGDGDNAIMEIPVTKEMFPFFSKDKTIEIKNLDIYVKRKQEQPFADVTITPLTDKTITISPLFNSSRQFEGWLEGSLNLEQSPSPLGNDPWRLSLPITELDGAEIEDIYLCASYNLK